MAGSLAPTPATPHHEYRSYRPKLQGVPIREWVRVLRYSLGYTGERMAPAQLVLVAVVGFTASFYGVVSGGGGLLVIPGLIVAGMPSPVAVASSRLGMLGLSLSGAYRYRRAGLIHATSSLPLMAVVTAGSAVGAVLLLFVDEHALDRFIGVCMILLAPLILFGRRLRLERPGSAPSTRRTAVGYALAFPIGIYSGLFGAAWATLFTYLMVTAFGRTFLQGAAMRTFVGIAVGVVTSLILGLGGKIAAGPAAVLFCSMLAGSYLGASFSLRQGEGYARQLVAAIAVIGGLKLLV